jgi:hypothetical protein
MGNINQKIMSYKILLITLFLCGNQIYAQDKCTVAMPSLSGSYTGECKKGLANGKGMAKGIDSYEGEFRKGYPEGSGKYHWADGTYYEGNWKQGMRDGLGKMIYPDSTVTGYWREDKYIGKKLIVPYEIITNRSVDRYSISKSMNTPNLIRIRITQGGADNTTISDLSIAFDSGSETRMGNVFAIQNIIFPVTVKVTYSTWTQLHTVQFEVTFEFRINEPGQWDVNISN